jgi:hypothetical protein
VVTLAVHTRVTEPTVTKHIKSTHLKDDNIYDLTEEEAVVVMVDYIEEHFGYTMSSKDVHVVI